MLSRLLDRLPHVAALEAVPWEWHLHLHPHCFDRLPSGYLVNTREAASWVPCRNRRSCRAPHNIEQKPDGRLIAYCEEDGACPPFEIQPPDRLNWKLDLPVIFRDLAETLSIDPLPELLTPNLWRLGTVSKTRVPAFFSFAANHSTNVAIVGSDRPRDFLFFVATPASASQALRKAVTSVSGRLGILSDHLAFDHRPRLYATLELTDLWGDLEREPPSGVAPLRVLPGTKWADIVVQLADRETIKVSMRTGGDSKTFTRDGLGLNNRRSKLQGAKLVWAFLVGLAEKTPDGIDLPADQADRDNLSNRVRELNKLLQRLVDGVPTEPPIRLSRKKNARRYGWNFKLSAKT